MNKELSYYTKPDNFMTEEQFEQVVEAILNGKYSWACVLILRFAGYNPLHYIPYRTYNRLTKIPTLTNKSNKTDSINPVNSAVVSKNNTNCEGNNLGAIADLEYWEIAGDRSSEIKGGNRELPLDLSHWLYMSRQHEENEL